ncbi:SusC/RagA family TonB-linked outer membrane protein [Arenibacter algicola]|uniref:SusC/RagA family TonB-linked outer membrane protein n=1 Tax=Arenibacter algicola TaxID=616991 RepID=UPI001C075068|nr:SusC/RagA family TonB-linked outer membrane protein [Arenibacter algicola]MBU2904340.1 SusC/RagA family TonB-linked outer membrane protein [Arenibacter algicola]
MKKPPKSGVIIPWRLKFDLKMKLSLLFLITVSFVMQANSSYSQKTKISLDFGNATMEEVIDEIEANTEFKFIFSTKTVDLKRKVSIRVKKVPIKRVLDILFSKEGIGYEVDDRKILLTRSKMKASVMEVESAVISDLPQILVSGTISDQNGAPLPGANILEKGTTNGTQADFDGNFSISVEDENTVLEVSYIGFAAKEIIVNGETSLNIVLQESAEGLDEVVITSFGIRKSKKSVVYATQEVGGDDLAQVGNPNVLNGLQGKVAGVSVNLSSGMPGRSPSIKIRGSRSLTGNNQPLFVIDGAPITGNIQDINPSNIESINVLKGPAASALYGLRASNGVVLISTKSGKSLDGKPTVNLETYYSVDDVAFLPDLQTEFGQGANGVLNVNGPFAWGPRITEIGTYTNNRGEQEEARSYDNDKAFYKSGSTSNTNLSISNVGTIGSYSLGLGHNSQEGIIPGTDLGRTNLNFNGKLNISEALSATVSFNYSDLQYSDFPDLTGNNNYFRSLTDTPPSYNLAGSPIALENDPYFQQYFRSGQNNPYWVVKNNYRNTERPRTLGNILFDYKISENLSINYRFGVDNFSSRTEDFRELGTGQAGRTNPPSGGAISILNQKENQINSNLFLTYNKELGKDFLLDLVVGNEVFDEKRNYETSGGSNFVTGGWANLANATIITGSNFESRQRIVGFYGNMNLGWQDMIFLNASGRNDYVSNMPVDNRSFFYPSVGTSFILTNIIPNLEEVISFAKIRATWAEVGQAGPLFVNGTGFVANNPGGFNFPYNGIASFSQQTTRINPNLGPENTKSYELGFDFRFFNDRLSIDYTYFNSISEGQIFAVPLPLSTGAQNEIRNAGEISSKGHEVILSLIPIRSPSFSWNLTTNFNAFSNKVVSLAEGVERIDINSGIIVAEEGFDYPSIAGLSYAKDPASGQPVIQSDSNSAGYGFPIMDNERKIIGSALPDFEMNFINNFTYKDLSLSFQIDWRSGGQIFSQSFVETRWRGLAGVTMDREKDDIIPGVKGTLVNGSPEVNGVNDIIIKKDYSYYNSIGAFNPTEQSLQDASFVRLREITLNYDLPEKVLGNSFVKSASVYVSGRNLFLLTDSFTDPEVNFTDGRSGNTAGLEWSQIPQTKSIGVGARIKF